MRTWTNEWVWPTPAGLAHRATWVALVGYLALSLVAGCSGESAGNGNDNQNQNANLNANQNLDGGVVVDAALFDYECPATQPDGMVCVHGQVKNILDDQPVAISPGAKMQRWVPPTPGDLTTFPTQLDSETEMASDGRFIFRSVPAELVVFYLDVFDLRLVDSAPSGYLVPDNRYGLASQPYSDPPDDAHYMLLNYYVLPEETIPTWENSFSAIWADEYCNGAKLSFSTNSRILLAVAYGEYATAPFQAQPLPALTPCSGAGFIAVMNLDPLEDRTCFDTTLLPDRTRFYWDAYNSDPDVPGPRSYSGVSLVYLENDLPQNRDPLQVSFHLGDILDDYGSHHAKVGSSISDPSSQVIVVHSTLSSYYLQMTPN
jgi:hypothetical protein